MRSGELARLAGVSTDTLRHYERLGLLAKPLRTTGGYRKYPAQAAERVRVIRCALTIGFSLPELAEILKMRDHGGVPCRRVRALAETKLTQVTSRIKQLDAMRRQLERVLKHWDTKLANAEQGRPARLLEALPRIRVPDRGSEVSKWKGERNSYENSAGHRLPGNSRGCVRTKSRE